MKQTVIRGLIVLACLGLNLAAQDWYRDREARYHDEHWRGRLFHEVREDLDHIGSAVWASGKERHRLDRTREELADLQIKLEHSRYDEPELNDVIDSMRKSANDERLSHRDRDVLRDDLNRLMDYREHHERWNR